MATLFGFDGSYYNTDTVKVEKGYWLRFGAPDVVDIEGLEIPMMEIGFNLRLEYDRRTGL